MKKLSINLVLLLFCFYSTFAQKVDAITGSWFTAGGEGKVQIYKKGDKYFGKLIWIKFPNDANGKPQEDVKNSEKAMQTRPVIGIELLKNIEYQGNHVYDGGTIYDPKNGKIYDCKLTLDGMRLIVRGSVSIFGRTDIWIKAD